MADAVLSAAVERIFGLIEEQAVYQVNLVRGAEKEVRSLADELNTIRNVLNDAENRRFHDKNINSWLSRLEHTSYQMEDVLDEWNYALLNIKMEQHQSDDASKRKVCSFLPSSSCLCFKRSAVHHDIARKIVAVKSQLDEIFKEKDRYGFVISQPSTDPLPLSWRDQSTSLIDLEEVHGRDRDGDILVSKLLGDGGSQEESAIQVVSVVGVGGLGKTTLAQLAYNHSRVEECFDLRIWICVSDPFDLVSIAKGILESVGEGSSANTNILDVLFKHVGESILGKKFLLVLDDVWTEDYNKWKPLKNSLTCGGAGSKILVTTRNERVAKMMCSRDSGIFHLGLLTDEDCWLLLCRMALPERNKVEFEDIGKKIAKKCDGLPLAARTLGSLLRFKSSLEEWEVVLNSEIWKMEELEVELFPHLLLSYKELSPTLKRCFSYCAVFPKDSIIYVESLIENWMALGYLDSHAAEMELKGRDCFNVLAKRSLFQDFKKNNLGEIKSCKMHDIVHDFAQFLRKSGKVEALEVNKKTCKVCDPLLVSVVNEFCCLFWPHRETPPHLCGCIKRLRVISLADCYLRSFAHRMGKFIHLRRLHLILIQKLESEDLIIIFRLYNLQTLALIDCSLEDIPMELGNLIHLRHLNLSNNEAIKKLPREIGNLIHLRNLNLNGNTSLKELPREIGNLIHLRNLNLIGNTSLKELPREIGNLILLRKLKLDENTSLTELPREIWNLINLRRLQLSAVNELSNEIGNLTHLRHLHLDTHNSLEELPQSIFGLQELQTLSLHGCPSLCRLPDGLGQLTSLCSLSGFKLGSGWTKLGILKNLNHLGGVLELHIRIGGVGDVEEVVEEARKAELRNKIHIEELAITIEDDIDEMDESSGVMRMDVIDALEPHPNLTQLTIEEYRGSKLPLSWIVSPLNNLREVNLSYFSHLTSLPPLGRLPCLEEILMEEMDALEIVGPEFLGIEVGISKTNATAFLKLKTLRFWSCLKLKEWEDITEEEEEEDSAAFLVMPCLTKLEIICCNGLTMMPHRLLRKAKSLKALVISRSEKLEERYLNKDGSDWKSITQSNPGLKFV